MYKDVLGATAVIIGAYSYIPYLRDIAKGKTKPHAFSWLIWGTMTAIAFVAQVQAGGKAGTWALGFTVAACGVIFVASLYRGEKRITRTDWACLIGAIASIALWIITDSPLLSVILVTLIDFLGVIPTLRKSYSKPHQETVVTYEISAIKFMLSILALSAFTIETVLYPASLVFSNALVVALLLIRRKQLQIKPAT